MRIANGPALVSVAIVLTLASSATAAVSFSSTTYRTPGGSEIVQAISGDFNGDGRPDVVVISKDHTLLYFAGIGDGTLQSPISTDISAITTDMPASAAAADFDGDGHLDVAIAYEYTAGFAHDSTTITVHFGDGSGHFTAGMAISTGAFPQSFAVGDFNGDGHVDLAVAAGADAAVWLHYGNGDGTFRPPTQITISPPGWIVAGDVDNNGSLDLIVATQQNLTVLLNDGVGTFTPVVQPGGGGEMAVVGDLNGDGNLDFVTAGWSTPDGVFSACIEVLLGNGHGHFASHSLSCAKSSGFGGGVALADFNTDGKLDIVTGGMLGSLYFGVSELQVLLGDGTGDFTAAYTLVAPWGNFVIDDFNGDGRPDVVANYSNFVFSATDVFAVLINTTPRGCVDTLSLSYASGTLTLGFTIQSTIPTLWNTWIAWQSNFVKLWSVQIPAVPTKVSFTLPIPNVPPLGNVGILTIMSSQTDGLMCGDWKIVDTGGIGPSAPTP